MVLYIRTIAQLPYPRSERVELFADTAEDLDAEQYVGVDRNKIAPGSYCITADGVLYLMNTSGEWVMATSGGGSKEPVLQALTATENGNYIPPKGVDGYNNVTVNVSGGSGEHILEITPVVDQECAVTDQESIDILNELKDNYLNGDGSYVLKVTQNGFYAGMLPIIVNTTYRSFSVMISQDSTIEFSMFGSSMVSVGGAEGAVVYLNNEGEETWYILPNMPPLSSSDSNVKSSTNPITDMVKNFMAKQSVSEPAKVAEATVEEVKSIKEE